MKTKLGLSVAMMGVAVYLCALMGGYTPMLLVAGYILIAEKNIWLRTTAAKACVLVVSFSVLSVLIGLIPDVCGLVNRVVVIFDESFYPEWVYQLESLLNTALSLVKNVLFLLLAYRAATLQTIKLGIVDAFVAKHVQNTDEQ